MKLKLTLEIRRAKKRVYYHEVDSDTERADETEQPEVRIGFRATPPKPQVDPTIYYDPFDRRIGFRAND